jgi:hypothetical protein
MENIEKLKYPIGEYVYPGKADANQLSVWIDALHDFPQQLAELAGPLSPRQLELTYRPQGWTVRQLIHHLADSHLNAYTRVKLTLTEDVPVIRPYREEKWAELPEAKTGDIAFSINLVTAVHQRLVLALRALSPEDFERQYLHPEAGRRLTLGYLVGNYAWHGQHHLAHIKLAVNTL